MTSSWTDLFGSFSCSNHAYVLCAGQVSCESLNETRHVCDVTWHVSCNFETTALRFKVDHVEDDQSVRGA